jgi:hypothetical protein
MPHQLPPVGTLAIQNYWLSPTSTNESAKKEKKDTWKLLIYISKLSQLFLQHYLLHY